MFLYIGNFFLLFLLNDIKPSTKIQILSKETLISQAMSFKALAAKKVFFSYFEVIGRRVL